MIKYAITDPTFFNIDTIDNYFNNLKADFVLYRDKKSHDYEKLAKRFVYIAKKCNIKPILHQNIKLSYELNAFGVHLTSLEFDKILEAKRYNLFTIISTHTIDEIKRAKRLGADAVTFSPIFKTPNKGEPKGVVELKKAIECCDIKVIALGGIVSKKEVDLIKNSNAYGFASIRYFI